MNRLILVRHGHSEHHTRGLTGGWADLPLTHVGLAQAEQVAERLAETDLDRSVAIWSSDLTRARQTAEVIARRLRLELVLDADLREFSSGRAAGLPIAEAKDLERPITHPQADWVPYEGGESWRSMSRRVFACLERLAWACPSSAIVVAHGHCGSAVIRWWLRFSEDARERVEFELAPASISEFTVNPWEERVIVRLNDTNHLSGA